MAAWYAERGWEILARNWRCALGEADIIAARTGVLVICEVKARRGDAFGSPFEAVTPSKQRRLRRVAAAWLAGNDQPWRRIRLDVAGVSPAGIEVLEDVLWSD